VVLVLVDMEGFPVAEVAAMLGIAEGTVKSRCARGRARLALMLGHLRLNPPELGKGNRAAVATVGPEQGDDGEEVHDDAR
jgi:RNA polymerase sigma-70 factor (ECF subfamily)